MGTQQQELFKLTEHIRALVGTLPSLENQRGVSIGIVDCVPYKDYDFEKLITFADDEAYIAKDSGRNKVVFYNKIEKEK